MDWFGSVKENWLTMLYSISNNNVKYLGGSVCRTFTISGRIRDAEKLRGTQKRTYGIENLNTS